MKGKSNISNKNSKQKFSTNNTNIKHSNTHNDNIKEKNSFYPIWEKIYII